MIECCYGVFCLFILEATAASLGFLAQVAQDKGKNRKVFLLECDTSPSNMAYTFGMVALLFLGAAQAVVLMYPCCVGGCHALWKSLKNTLCSPGCIMLFFVAMWGACGLGMLLFWTGAKHNKRKGTDCGLGHYNRLRNGACACLAHFLISVIYWVMCYGYDWKEEDDKQTKIKVSKSSHV